MLITVGTNYKYSPIELRERLSFSKHRLRDALCLLKENQVLKGGVILSTCNRVEIYGSVEDEERGIREIKNSISRFHEIEQRKFSPYLYIYEEKKVVRHLFSVACGLDSLILGETQILGQVKSAFLEAKNIGFVDEYLESAFSCAITFAKEMHQKTKISEDKVSIGSVAIDFIKEKLGSLANKNILIIGIGKVTELVLEYLKKEKTNVVLISNRTFHKASQLAGKIGAEAVRFDELNKYLNKADIVITATRSPHFIIRKHMLEAVIRNEPPCHKWRGIFKEFSRGSFLRSPSSSTTNLGGLRRDSAEVLTKANQTLLRPKAFALGFAGVLLYALHPRPKGRGIRAKENKLLIVDLALPRNVDPEVREINNVELFCFEDFSSIIKKNAENKSCEEKIVNALIEKETEKIWSKLTKLEPVEALLP